MAYDGCQRGLSKVGWDVIRLVTDPFRDMVGAVRHWNRAWIMVNNRSQERNRQSVCLLVPLAPGVDVAAAETCAGGAGPIDPGTPDAGTADSDTSPGIDDIAGAVIENGSDDSGADATGADATGADATGADDGTPTAGADDDAKNEDDPENEANPDPDGRGARGWMVSSVSVPLEKSRSAGIA